MKITVEATTSPFLSISTLHCHQSDIQNGYCSRQTGIPLVLCVGRLSTGTRCSQDNILLTNLAIATQTIPKSSTKPKRIPRPWFNKACLEAIQKRKRALHAYKINPTNINQALFRAARAMARRVVKESKKNSWKSFTSRINSRTSVKKTWDMVRKISGKNISPTSTHLITPDGREISDKNEIANKIARTISKNSSTANYSDQFQRHKATEERKKINFNSNEE